MLSKWKKIPLEVIDSNIFGIRKEIYSAITFRYRVIFGSRSFPNFPIVLREYQFPNFPILHIFSFLRIRLPSCLSWIHPELVFIRKLEFIYLRNNYNIPSITFTWISIFISLPDGFKRCKPNLGNKKMCYYFDPRNLTGFDACRLRIFSLHRRNKGSPVTRSKVTNHQFRKLPC